MCLSPDGRRVSNVEMKTVDATINPYCMLAAVLQAGMWGLQHKATLPQPVQTDPASQVSPVWSSRQEHKDRHDKLGRCAACVVESAVQAVKLCARGRLQTARAVKLPC